MYNGLIEITHYFFLRKCIIIGMIFVHYVCNVPLWLYAWITKVHMLTREKRLSDRHFHENTKRRSVLKIIIALRLALFSQNHLLV